MPRLLPLLVGLLPLVGLEATARAEVRERAIVDLSFDQPEGDAADAAKAGAVADVGKLNGGATRVPSPFWNQRGGRAVRLERGERQSIEIADGADVDRPDAVSVSLFVVNLEPPTEQGYFGLFGKRRPDGDFGTNYGINYGPAADNLQVYVNDGSGFKVVGYSVKRDLGYRRLGHVTATFEVADAPGADADTDRDDVRVRLFVNGIAATPSSSAAGFIAGTDAWITDVNPAGLLNDVPLAIGGSNPGLELASLVVDEVLVFATALSPEEALTLFREVAGADGPELAKREVAPATVVSGPEILSISPPVLSEKTTTRLTIGGVNLEGGTLVIPGLEFDQTIVAGSNKAKLIVDVTPKSAGEGRFPVRVATSRGASNVRPMALTSLPIDPAASATAEQPANLPRAFHGVLGGSQSHRVHVVGRAGQQLVAEVESRRLGGRFDPVIEIETARGTPLAIEWGGIELSGDTRAMVELPADGVYVIELHDLAFKAPGGNPFVLRVGEGVAAANDRETPEGRLVEERSVTSEPATVDARFSESPHVPLVVRGTLGEPGEEDRYVFEVTPGQTLGFALQGRAIDSPIDGVLAIHAEPGGNQVAYSEDNGADRDPRANYTVPGGAKQIAVRIRDLHGHGGEAFHYDLRVQPAGQPDFALTLEESAILLPRSGTAVVRLNVERRGYNGAISLGVAGSDEITLDPAVVPAGLAGTMFVTLRRTAANAEPTALVRILGRTEGLAPPLVRTATVKPAPNDIHVGSSGRDLAITPIDAAAMTVTVSDLAPALFPGDVAMPTVTIVRPESFGDHPVRLTLLTNEPPRPVDPKDAAKGNRPLVRSEDGFVLNADGASASLPVLVPLDIAVTEIDAVIRAEVVRHAFSDDVVATAYSAPFRLPVRAAVAVTIDVPSLTFAATGGEIRGEAVRAAGFDRVLVIEATGLPAGYTANPTTLPVGGSQFAIAVQPPPPGTTVDPAAKPEPRLRIRLEDGRDVHAPLPLAITIEKTE